MIGIEQSIATLGFPIAIVIYLLYERHTGLKSLEKVIGNDLTHAIYDLREEIHLLRANVPYGFAINLEEKQNKAEKWIEGGVIKRR